MLSLENLGTLINLKVFSIYLENILIILYATLLSVLSFDVQTNPSLYLANRELCYTSEHTDRLVKALHTCV